uniref:DUF58 domain-containing protein n=1 Tax=Ignisphaera aggregans TaxID=334771 RepID=A0A7C4BCB8_9CREN
MKITLYGVAGLVLPVVAILYGLASENLLLYSLGLALLLIFYKEYKSFTRVKKAVEKLAIERRLERGVVSELDDVGITLTIDNRGLDAIPRALVVDIPPRYAEARAKPIAITSIPPRASISITYRVTLMAPGTHPFDKVVIIASDFLGYFTEELHYSAKGYVTALPLVARVDISMKTVQKVLGVNVMGRAIGGLYDIADIREYQPGDNIKKIVWSAYAKMGKLMVREDYGESRARILLLIDIRPWVWGIGSIPNTLAHIQLRFASSLLAAMLRSGLVVDTAICSELMPKVMPYQGEDYESTAYRIFSVLDAGEGCHSPMSVFTNVPSYIGRSAASYDLVVLITNPLALALENPRDFTALGEVFNKLLIAMPMFRYEEYLSKESILKLLKRVAEVLGGSLVDIEFSEEGFEVSKRA